MGALFRSSLSLRLVQVGLRVYRRTVNRRQVPDTNTGAGWDFLAILPDLDVALSIFVSLLASTTDSVVVIVVWFSDLICFYPRYQGVAKILPLVLDRRNQR